MGLSTRIFLLDGNDCLYRLPNATFDRMLRDPSSYPIPLFAGERLRAASMLIELSDRRPTRVVRTTYGILAFDNNGCFDAKKFQCQQFARVEPIFALISTRANGAEIVVDASTRFLAQGGSWTPSKNLAHRLSAAALEYVKYNRL